MEIATFSKLFSGSVSHLIGCLFIAAAPFVPPGRAVAVPELAGVYGPPRPVAAAARGEADLVGPRPQESLSFRADGEGWYRVRLAESGRTCRFRARVYEEYGARILDLIPEEDLGWDAKTAGSHLLVGFSLRDGELALTELGRSRRVYRFYRLKKARGRLLVHP